ncbi:MAG TPA: TatD family hydrolase [Phycisphaerae bacterium]|nr:TatD family hydrolase [Phycisphaerae bacterium]HRY68166.1 TatD family hydrolase [Phycisphaerae bacterium]HSA27062.1 TatD family hydrolase [Phycisphaerae bacterium]
MELFDTHCHLSFADLAARAGEVVAGAIAAGVTRFITVASGSQEACTAIGLRQRHTHLWVAAGIHPHEAGKADPEEFARLAALWKERPEIVAAGEIGLDYHYDFSPRDVQRSVFMRQLELARTTGLPIIIHSREAHGDAVRILLDQGYAGRRVVFHCFSGTPEQAVELRSHGWWTSFTGVITFKKADVSRRVCVETPVDQLMFETDSPYLSPEPVRGMKPNEPRNLPHTVRFAAELRGMELDDLAAASTANAERFFGLDQRGCNQ